MEMSARKLAAHIRTFGDDRREVLRAAVDAMHVLRGRDRTLGTLSQPLLQDRTIRRLLRTDDALGVISQSLAEPALESAYRATTMQKRKFTDDEIPIVTQLFTPRWVVEFLLQNSLGKLWLEMYPRSPLRRRWTWLVDPPRERARDVRPVESIRILDPACGTMNFGLVAIEMLRAMYREEDSSRSLAWIDHAIVEHNLFGFDIDPVALEFAEDALRLKLDSSLSRKRQMSLLCCDALLDVCDAKFDIVATNPPYLSARNLSRETVSRLKKRYPNSWRDAYACFIERAIELLNESGRAAVLTMQSFMFTGAFESLRQSIDQRTAIETIAHFGPGLFDVGNPGTLQTVAFVARRESDQSLREVQNVNAFRLVDRDDKRNALAKRVNQHRTLQRNLRDCPRGAWCYWLTSRQREVFTTLPKLEQIARPVQGLATTDNARFVRYWWEVPTNDTWVPYVKSGRNRSWYESPQHRVNWRDDGAEIKQAVVERYPYLDGQWQWVAKNAQHYFKPGITYSYLTSGQFSARRLDAGAIFDVAGSSLFPEDVPTMLAILNSSVARQLLDAINPTVNFQVGDLRELPIPLGSSDALRADVLRAIEITRTLDTFDETSPDFVAPCESEGQFTELHRELREIEFHVDATVAKMYGLPCERSVRPLPKFEQPGETLRVDGVVELSPDVAVAFDARHVKLFKRRPRVWVFADSARSQCFAVHHEQATREAVSWIAGQLGESIPHGWDRFIDDGIAVNLAPLAHLVLNRQLKKELPKFLDAKWSQTYRATRHFNRAMIASVNCAVLASPPKSRVSVLPSASTAS